MTFDDSKSRWLDSCHAMDVRSAETDSGIPLQVGYFPEDIASIDYERDLGFPGQFPFTRGVYGTMYRTNLWTFRQYAGFGTAEESNARYKYLLKQGQTALSVAFDLPTQLGYDSDTEGAEGEVGRVGVAIDSVDDMEVLFDGLPLDTISVNFTINATAPIVLALFLATARRRGVSWESLSGTLQNDILKEYLARKTYIFPPEPSLRLIGDVVEFCSANAPRFNPISVTGYHAREAGCNAVQELAFAISAARAYIEVILKHGLDIDDFAPRISFHFSTTLDFFEEVAKLRAARRMWARLVTDCYQAKNPRSAALRFFSGCSGTCLTAVEPLNNLIRSTIQCMAAVMGGAQSIHVMAYDEALEIPSEESALLSLRTQQIIANETGIPNVIDPLGGSYFVESLTNRLEDEANRLIQQIDDLGGFVKAITSGVPQQWIAETAYKAQQDIQSGTKKVIGLNTYANGDDSSFRPRRLFQADGSFRAQQRARVQQVRATRDGNKVARCIRTISETARTDANLMPALIEASEAGVTVGEMSDALRACFGEYQEQFVL